MKVYNVHLLTLVIALSSAVELIEALDTVCLDRFNDLSFADPASCSSFYMCQRGKAIRRECSNGLYFDPKIQSCNLPGLIRCFNGDRGGGELKPVAATTVKPLTTTCITTTTKPATTTKKPKAVTANVTPAPIVVYEEMPAGLDVRRFSQDCRGVEDGEYLTDPRHCRRYYMCQNNRAKRHNCPRNEWFDRETKTCQNRDDVLNCPSRRN
ncbi:uncharacterized protein LOC128260501 isoform X1 [Drosophila gunungcola]|uniref:uncharacterized protein LOC128260501 isoform X1 n=1 Tax=Drosophila gunungcola TaxID=103775 RepID=UPI0022DF3F09|nr:uncharacterized protein LOC128260501 isoform X1 [Drosophila gunungcola]